MDPATLAAGAVGALVPYLAEAGKEVAKKAGGAVWDGAGKLWTLLRSKLTRPEQQSVLADLETHVDNKNVQGAAIWQLEKALAEDAELARALAELLASLPGADKRRTWRATATSSARRIAAAASTSRAENGRQGCRRIATADPELIVRFSRATGSDSIRSVGQREQ